MVGKVFWLGAVAAIGGRERWTPSGGCTSSNGASSCRERRASVGGEVEYAFWHALVRDVAYGQIPRAARAERHRAAEWIGSRWRQTGSRTAPSCSRTTTCPRWS